MSAVGTTEARETDPGSGLPKGGEPIGAISQPLDPDRRQWIGAIGAWLRTGTGIIGSIVTVLAASLTVIFLLVPSLKPSTPNNQFGASFSDARIETDVVLSSYYERIREAPPSTLTADKLAQKGVVVSFTVVIEGFQGKSCLLTWSAFDATTNKRSTVDWLVERAGWPSKSFTPVGLKDQGNGEIFVPYPPTPGSYFVRMELTDPNGTRLTTIDSPVFEVTGSSDAPAPVGLPTAIGG